MLSLTLLFVLMFLLFCLFCLFCFVVVFFVCLFCFVLFVYLFVVVVLLLLFFLFCFFCCCFSILLNIVITSFWRRESRSICFSCRCMFILQTWLFSSPEQRSVVLNPVSALALALALASVKVLRSLYFQTLFGPPHFQALWCIWVIFGIVKDADPTFYAVPFPPNILRSGSRTWLFVFKFYVKVFGPRISKPCDVLVHVWYGNRYWSKILRSTIPTLTWP